MVPAPKIIVHSSDRRQSEAKQAFRFDEADLPAVADQRLQAYRQQAWQAYQSLPFPTLKDEAWRRTDIRGLNTSAFQLSTDQDDVPEPSARLLESILAGKARAGQIVAGTAEGIETLDESLRKKGVVFTTFRNAEEQHADLLDRLLGQVVTPTEDKFTALAAAMAADGVLLYVPKGVIIEDPLNSLYWGGGAFRAMFSHLVIWLDDDAQATFVHETASPRGVEDSQMLHDGIVEIHVGARARLNFVELQSWGDNVWSFTRERARVMADGVLEWIFGAMGTRLTKNFSDIELVEAGAVGRMSGFYFASGEQHLDHDTQQNHLAPNTTSDLLYKGALKDHSRSVWQGMIYVAPGAIGTDGYQANRNLILSKGARADSIPGLEILADDVRCTHGATVGKLDEDMLFYLVSRGIPRAEAEELIVAGFFAPIMERIPFEGVRERFSQAIQDKIHG